MSTRTRLFLICLSFSFLPSSSALAQDPCLNCARDAQNGAAWCDDFEIASGPNGPCYDTQNCTVEPEIPTGCNDWRPWFDNEAVHAVINCDQNLTPGGEQSMAIDTDDDQVRVFNAYDANASGFWIISTHIYIPSNMSGEAFWIVNPDYPDPGTTWAIAISMRGDGTITEECGDGDGGPGIPTDQWFEIRCEVNLAADKVRIFVDDSLFGQHGWTDAPGPGCGINASLQIQAIDLFSFGASRFYYDDISVCPAEVPSLLPPELRCQTIDRLESGCVDYFFSFTNVNVNDFIDEFWVDVEAGDGGQICTGVEDITPPAGWTAELCAPPWDDGHALIRMNTDPPGIPVGGTVTGRIRVDPNGPTPTVTGRGFEVPPFSILMHAAQTIGNPDATCDPDFFCPACSNPVACNDNTDCEIFEVDCVNGFCEGILRGSFWSAPTNVCTAFLSVPAMTTWAKAVLAAMLIGGGALLVLRGRRTHATL